VAAGVCYENILPVALAQVASDIGTSSAIFSSPGATVMLDGSGSLDPEGLQLTFRWMLLTAPPGATQTTGTIFCQQSTCDLGPLKWGLYRVGLWVQDSAGGWSPQSQATIFVK